MLGVYSSSHDWKPEGRLDQTELKRPGNGLLEYDQCVQVDLGLVKLISNWSCRRAFLCQLPHVAYGMIALWPAVQLDACPGLFRRASSRLSLKPSPNPFLLSLGLVLHGSCLSFLPNDPLLQH
jgi:hypothetical protein